MALKKVEKRLYALEAEHLRDRALSSVEFLLKLLFLPALCPIPSCLAHTLTVAHTHTWSGEIAQPTPRLTPVLTARSSVPGVPCT